MRDRLVRLRYGYGAGRVCLRIQPYRRETSVSLGRARLDRGNLAWAGCALAIAALLAFSAWYTLTGERDAPLDLRVVPFETASLPAERVPLPTPEPPLLPEVLTEPDLAAPELPVERARQVLPLVVAVAVAEDLPPKSERPPTRPTRFPPPASPEARVRIKPLPRTAPQSEAEESGEARASTSRPPPPSHAQALRPTVGVAPLPRPTSLATDPQLAGAPAARRPVRRGPSPRQLRQQHPDLLAAAAPGAGPEPVSRSSRAALPRPGRSAANAGPRPTLAGHAGIETPGPSTLASARVRERAPAPGQPAREDERPGRTLRGVPLGSLASCVTDREEEALKRKLLATIRNETECKSAAGLYRFLETKNLNAFLMWIERAESRGEADRCVELSLARECLKQQSGTREDER